MTAAFRNLLGGADRLVVVDTETTGVFTSDRVVELALVTMTPEGKVVDEWESLIQPGRAVTATHIHGISATMVAHAPTFEEIAGEVALRLESACVAAHNLPFDRRMMENEFRRLGASLVIGSGVDTLVATGARLPIACKRHNIELGTQHRALEDARATAHLLTLLAPLCRPGVPASAPKGFRRKGRVLRREDTKPVKLPDPSFVAGLAAKLSFDGADPAALAYLEVLERALEDLHLDRDERSELAELARSVGLGDAEIRHAHRQFVDELIDAALADHILTSDENEELVMVGSALEVDQQYIDTRLRPFQKRDDKLRIEAGMRVVFTGKHMIYTKAELKEHAKSMGLYVQNGVTKSTDLVAAEDPESNSSKAEKARRYGIPIVSMDSFSAADQGDEIPARMIKGALKAITCPTCLKTWTAAAGSSEHRSKPCPDCSRTPSPRRHTPDPSRETLFCTGCGQQWQRVRTRGQKPVLCPSCAL